MVVGLGNPGRGYAGTRHNVGFRVADELARRFDGEFRRGVRSQAHWCRVRAGEAGELLLVKPQTYMNLSGQAVQSLLRKHRLGPADLVVAYDDADLPAGALRIRPGGGAGGHNGMKSVIERIGTEDFVRVRIGVGRDPGGIGLKDHVLSRFSAEEAPAVAGAVAAAAEAVCAVARDGVDKAMNRFNR